MKGHPSLVFFVDRAKEGTERSEKCDGRIVKSMEDSYEAFSGVPSG